MEYTSAEANKLLKKLNDVHQARLYEEEQCSTFLAAMGEEPESLRPEYDYAAVQEKLRELEEKNHDGEARAQSFQHDAHRARLFYDDRPGAGLSAVSVGASQKAG